MPIGGLMLTLCEDARLQDAALAALALDDRVELGPRHGRRVAVVTETRSPEDDRALWAHLNELPGVTFVDVVFATFDQPDSSTSVAREAAST